MSIRWRGFDLSKIDDATLRSQLQRLDTWLKQRDAELTSITSTSTFTSIVTLIPHASTHLPDNSDALTTVAPSNIGTANSAGTANSFVRSDHVHNHPIIATGDLHTQYLRVDGTVRDMTGELGTDVGTFRSDVVDGGNAFTFNTTNTFASGTLFRIRENGTTHLAVNHNGNLDILAPNSPGTHPLNVDEDGYGFSAQFDGPVGIAQNPDTDASLSISFTHSESSAASKVVCDALMLNSATNTSGVGNAYGVRTQVSNISTTTGMRTRTVGGIFNARLKSDTIFTSGIAKLVGGHFEADSAGSSVTGTTPIANAGEFIVQPTNGTFTTITGVEVDAFNTTSMTTGGGTTVYGIRLLDLTGVPSGAGTTPTTADVIRIDAQDGSNKGAGIGNIRLIGAGFDEGHLQLNSGHIWANAGDIAFKDSAPTSLTDYLLSIGSSNVDIKVDVIIQDGNGLVVGHSAKIDFGAIPEFQILGTGAPDSSMGFALFSANANAATLRYLKRRSGTLGTNTIVQDGDELGRIRFQAADGGDFNTNAAEISAEVDGAPGLNDMPGRILFSTTSDGSSSVTERMRIDSAGNVGVGASTPSTHFEVEGSGIQRIRVESTDDQAGIEFVSDSTNAMIIYSPNTSDDLRVFGTADIMTWERATGNVGIGTNSPNALLDVNGEVFADAGREVIRYALMAGA